VGDRTETTVTVAVVTKGQPNLLAGCIDALAGQTPSAQELLVVVNGAGPDANRAIVEKHAGPEYRVRLIHQPGSLGMARQRAVEEARGQVLAFTDSDCRPQPGWLAALVAPFADPSVDVVQGRTLPAGPVPPYARSQRIEEFTGRYETCNIAYRLASLRRAGGFDADWPFFGEDTDAGWRLRSHGGGQVFAPAAVVHHEVLPGGPAWQVRWASRYGAWNALVRRHPAMRDELLWHRWFLRRRSAEFDALVLGTTIGLFSRRRAALVVGALLAMPWLHRFGPRPGVGWRDTARSFSFDAAVCVALARGSWRERTLVL
jgi:GT2 family glycosyltransferase